ncbi:MAG: hypothetical protein CUN54_09450 [Phototrophicales bacterium]|nr:MAG: hypothetical protein CUN54_09450 [Phototrophicales bacterium]
MSADSAYRITKASGDFSPHVARRTLLTELLKNGTSLPDAQFIAGHAHGSTTMHYAKVADALEVKGRLRVSY